MPCLLALLALATPRAVIVLLVIFTDYIGRAFDGIILPFLGFLFLPTTTLAYSVAINERGSVSGIYLLLVAVAVLLDLGLLGGGGRRLRRS